MSEETVPRQDGADARPQGLLQQMEELMAALNADLSALDATSSRPGARRGRPARSGATTEAVRGCEWRVSCLARLPLR
nr:hypothetical protein [Streptomyces sp. alain-838]